MPWGDPTISGRAQCVRASAVKVPAVGRRVSRFDTSSEVRGHDE